MCFILSVFLFIKAMSKLAELIRLQLVGVRVDFVSPSSQDEDEQ